MFYNNNLATLFKMWSKIFGRKSTKNLSRRSIEHKPKPLKPEEFDDVFGGPPRCLNLHLSDYFYEDMFHNPIRRGVESGVQDFPNFRISLARGLSSEMFCSDFIKEVDEVRGSDLSKSSMLKSEEINPILPPIIDNDIYLRPISLQSTWNDTSTLLMHGMQQKHEEMPDFTNNRLVGNQFTDTEQQTESFRSTRFGFSRRASSSESMSPSAYSYSSVKVSVGDEHKDTNKFHEDDDEDSEIISSYFFKINSSYRGGTDHDGVGVDEAIAWAKESYQSHSSSSEMTDKPDGRVDESRSLHLQEEYQNKMKAENEQRNGDEYRELNMLEGDIKLWSSGNERNIELLLSTLQDILWPNSGWCPIHSTNLYESSNVKKAY